MKDQQEVITLTNLTRAQEMELIFNQLELKIKKHIKETVLDEREDLSQEMKVKIIEKINIFLDSKEEVPGFFEYISTIT